MTIDRRKLARLYDTALIIAGALVAYAATDPDAKEYLAQLGGWVTMAIGALNIILNRLPRPPAAPTDEEPQA